MDTIAIRDLEVFYQVGVTEQERSLRQRLLLTVEMESDFTAAVAADSLSDTVDYEAVCRRLLCFGDDRHWQLIETLASDIAGMVLEEFHPRAVTVEVKKFVIPRAREISVRLARAAHKGSHQEKGLS